MKTGIVVLDTLRYDTFLLKMSTVSRRAYHPFHRIYSTSRWTAPAHASLFTGLYPTEVGTQAHNRHLTTDRSTVAESLQKEEFHTRALSNNVHIDSFFKFDRGFDQLDRCPDLRGRPSEDRTDFDWGELFSAVGDGPLRYLRTVQRIAQSDSPTLPTLRAGLEHLRTPAVN